MNTSNYNKQQGLTIIEILIAILLSTILLTGVIQIFAATSQSYRTLDGLSRIQENGRFSIAMLSQDLQMSGFYGCNNGDSFTNTLNNSTDLQYQHSFPIAGYDDVAAATPAVLTTAGITPDAGTDVIIIRRTDGEPYRLASTTTDSNVVIEATSVIENFCTGSIDQVNGFCPGDIMMIADCSKSVVFQSGTLTVSGSAPDQIATITHPSGSAPGNATPTWGGGTLINQFINDANSVVYRLSTIAYYIQTVSGIPTLFRYENGTSDELIDGVEDMQVQYGEDTSGDGIANAYVDAFANTVANEDRWNSIVGTKIRLLVRSVNSMAEETLSYTFNGNIVDTEDMTSGDKFVRREFATTVALRNHAS